MKPYEYFTSSTRGTIYLKRCKVHGRIHFFASDDGLAWYRVSHKTAEIIRSHNAGIKKDNRGDIEHQMTATNDNTSVFCQECGHHYIDMGE